ncbi:MAG: hypothetical protein R6V50_00770 [Thermoplasmatota archaeon]
MKKANKTKKNMLVIALVTGVLLLGIVFSGTAVTYDQNNSNQLGNGNNLVQRIRNRVCDMLGICQGGCELTELTGVLEYDEVNFFIEDVELHFGPNWYITAAISSEDFDGDGEYELIIDELLGLVGIEITVEGHLQSENWMSVFTINGLVYREPGQPIWAAQHHWRWRNRKNQN